MKRSLRILIPSWIVLGTVGFLVPTGIGILIGLTPNAVLRQADVGQFVTAEVRSHGFFGGGLTSVRTTRGSFTVKGPFSSEQGQPLVVRQDLKDPLALCGATAPTACAQLAGTWAGPLPPVPRPPLPFALLVTAIGADGVGLWFLFAALVALLMAIVSVAILTADEDEPAPTAPTSHAS